MIYILATILSSTSIFVIFRLAKNFSCGLFSIITINYFVAALFGFIFFVHFDFKLIFSLKPWLFSGMILGTLFIVMFFLIGHSAQKAGITITTLANKISLVFPVLFSIIWFHEKISVIKYFALLLAILSISLTLYRKDIRKTNFLYFFLPVTIFIGGGITDSVVKYAQSVKIHVNELAHFSAFVFLIAFILAVLVSVFNRKALKINFRSLTLFLGILLGLVNFGSLYFFINALNKSNLDSSVVFALVNISIVILSALTGRLFFNEYLSKINVTGVILAILSLILLI